MTCKFENNWSITSRYHLEFDDWTEVIGPTVELFKDLISEFEKGIANSSDKAFCEVK